MEQESDISGSPQQAVQQEQLEPPAPVDPPTPADAAPRRRLMMLLVGGGAFVVLVVVLVVLSFQSRGPQSAVPGDEVGVPSTETYVPAEPTSPVDVPNQQADPDLPPLYPGVEWEEVMEERVRFIDGNLNQIRTTGYSRTALPKDSYPFEFVQYYKEELEKRGWIQTADAGSSGDGETYFYQKGDKYFNFGVIMREGTSGIPIIQYELN